MTLIITKKNFFLSSAAVAAFFTMSEVNAGIIKIKNHSRNNIQVEVAQEISTECGDFRTCPYCWKCLCGTFSTQSQHIKNIIVPKSAFHGNNYFSVIGTEGGILANGECVNLNVLKDYEVSFYETFAGLRCESKVI